MLMELLLAVIILGLIAWAIYALPIPDPFRTIAIVVLCIIVVLYVFRNLLGTSLR